MDGTIITTPLTSVASPPAPSSRPDSAVHPPHHRRWLAAQPDFSGSNDGPERHQKRGRLFRYYRCTHKNKQQRCDERSFIRHDKFAEEVKRNAQLAIIPDEWKEKCLAKIETWESKVSLEKQQKIDAFKSDLTSLKAKIDRINNGFTEGSIDITEFKELKNPLVVQKTNLEQQIVALEGSEAARTAPKVGFRGK